LNEFDYSLLLLLNKLADCSPLLDKVMVGIYGDALKTALIVALLWWAWFDNERTPRQREARERIAACVVASVVCIAGVRLLAAVLPFRVRPLANPLLGLHFPLEVGDWGSWSAFPSDNAVLFSMLATCLFYISRPLGLIAALDVALLICLPRVFLGIHHPSDVIVGASIGVWVGMLVNQQKIRRPLSAPVFAIMRRHPSFFYASAFMITFLFAQVFWPVTRLAIETVKLARTLASL
jgi:membrane-associated phospholipid phosphatase